MGLPDFKSGRRALITSAVGSIPTRSRHIIILLAPAVAAVAALPYLAAGIGSEFISLDDPLYVSENPPVRAGLSLAGLRWALTSFHASNWHPLTWLFHMANVSLFGLDPRGHHLMSVLLHALAAALLFLALCRMSGSPWRSAFAAALFGVHPLHVESVAWIAEQKDVLAGLFFMFILLAYERYARHGGSGRYLLVALFFALGLAAKPMLVTVPLVLLLLDLWPLGRTARNRLADGSTRVVLSRLRLVAEKIPLLVLAALSSLITFHAQRAGGAITGMNYIPPESRLANALISSMTYLSKTVWPSSLAVYYPHPLAMPSSWKIILAALALAVLSATALLQFRRQPFLAVGWFWYIGMLLPVIGIIQVGAQAAADRYTYLPLIGLFLFLSWIAPATLVRRRTLPALLGAGSILVLVGLSAAATIQAHFWRDSETLFSRTLTVTRNNWMMENGLGIVLAQKGQLEAAIVHFRNALRLRPNFAEAHNNLGVALAGMGRFEEALWHYRHAVGMKPDFAEAHVNIGIDAEGLGRLEEAITHYRKAVQLHPEDAEARQMLALVLEAAGRRHEPGK